jgi:hypothetical protein
MGKRKGFSPQVSGDIILIFRSSALVGRNQYCVPEISPLGVMKGEWQWSESNLHGYSSA